MPIPATLTENELQEVCWYCHFIRLSYIHNKSIMPMLSQKLPLNMWFVEKTKLSPDFILSNTIHRMGFISEFEMPFRTSRITGKQN